MELRSLMIPALIGLGLYAQSNNMDLANNTTTLLTLGVLLAQQQELNRHACEIERLNLAVFGTTGCGMIPPPVYAGGTAPAMGTAPFGAPSPYGMPFPTPYRGI